MLRTQTMQKITFTKPKAIHDHFLYCKVTVLYFGFNTQERKKVVSTYNLERMSMNAMNPRIVC